jgi:hypothetical protein
MRRIIVTGDRVEVEEFCLEDEIMAQEDSLAHYRKAKQLARWKKTRDTIAWLENMPWY